MKRLLFLGLTLCLAVSAHAQFVTVDDDIEGVLTYPSLLGGVAWDEDGEHEVFGIRGEYKTKDVLISNIEYTYSAVYSGCVASVRFIVTREKPTRTVGGLISHVEEGYKRTEYVTVDFVPVDEKWIHWRGTLIANPANEWETVTVEMVDANVVKKADYTRTRTLISSDK